MILRGHFGTICEILAARLKNNRRQTPYSRGSVLLRATSFDGERVGSGTWDGQEVYDKRGVTAQTRGLFVVQKALTKRCTRPTPRAAVFSIRLSHKVLGVGQVWLPVVRARCGLVSAGVSAPGEAWCVLQGASPCRGRTSHPPVARGASVAESARAGEQDRRSVHSESCRP